MPFGLHVQCNPAAAGVLVQQGGSHVCAHQLHGFGRDCSSKVQTFASEDMRRSRIPVVVAATIRIRSSQEPRP